MPSGLIEINSWTELNKIRITDDQDPNYIGGLDGNYILTANLSKNDADYYEVLFPETNWEGNWEERSLGYEEDDLVFHNNYYWIANKSTVEEPDSSSSDWDEAEGWEPIGWSSEWGVTPSGDFWLGNFYGDEYTISDLYIHRCNTFLGLFGYSDGNIEVHDLGIVNATIYGGFKTGALIGEIKTGDTNKAIISNCYSTGKIVQKWGFGTNSYFGGLIGRVDGCIDHVSEINNCHSECNVESFVYRYREINGGFIGEIRNVTIKDCYATGNVVGRRNVGGLIGRCSPGGSNIINNCYATGNVTAPESGGGTVGNHVGGLIGASGQGTVTNCYATGNVTGKTRCGGFVGHSHANFPDSIIYENCYSIGSVSAPYSQGGFSHSRGQNTTMSNCFYDSETSGQDDDEGHGKPRTTLQMKDINNYAEAGWEDNEIETGDEWDIELSETDLNDGYPFLSWQLGGSASPTWYIFETPKIIEDDNLYLLDTVKVIPSRIPTRQEDKLNFSDEVFLQLSLLKEKKEDKIVLSDEIRVAWAAEESIEEDTLKLSDEETTHIAKFKKNLNDDVLFSDELNLFVSYRFKPEEKIVLGDETLIKRFLRFKINTTLITSLTQKDIFNTYLVTAPALLSEKFYTDLRTKSKILNKFNTDLRVKTVDYDLLKPTSLDDICVKLDGVELNDVSIDSLRINFNLNREPSTATFIMARRHDGFDHDLNGNESKISEENEITVYDGDYLLFRGYVVNINAHSRTDTIEVTAKDARYKMANISYNLSYGGKVEVEKSVVRKWWREYHRAVDKQTNHTSFRHKSSNVVVENDNVYIKTFNKAIKEVLNFLVSENIISGYEDIDFCKNYVPEYFETTNDCASILSDLISNGANINWYLDENEKIRFQKISKGEIKTLNLSSLDKKRHLYDVILSDVQLNQEQVGYATKAVVKMGNKIDRTHRRITFTDSLSPDETLKSYAQRWWKDSIIESFVFLRFVGNNINHWSYISQVIHDIDRAFGRFFTTLFMKHVFQIQPIETHHELDDVVVGSGDLYNTAYQTNYGIKIPSTYWEEREDEDGLSWLVEIRQESYDQTNFAKDLANFELSQYNQKQTTADVSLTLDSFKYNKISFKNRINLDNTIEKNIYKNNNKFPLHVEQYTFTANNKTITMRLNNYGKSWHEKKSNILDNYKSEKILRWITPKGYLRIKI